MGLEELKKHILENSREKVNEIERESSIKLKETEEGFKAKIAEKERIAKLKIENELRLITQIRTAAAKSEATQQILEKKRELIEAAIRGAKEVLKQNNSAYLARLLAKAKLQIEVERVYCSKEDARYLKIETMPMELDGGIIAENKDETVSVDFSYDALLEQIKEKHLFDISKVLFE